MGTAYEAAMRGGEGGILLFTFLLCIIVVSSYDSWYATSPVRRGFQWHSRLFSRSRRDANDDQQGRSLYQKWRGLDTRSDQFQRLMKCGGDFQRLMKRGGDFQRLMKRGGDFQRLMKRDGSEGERDILSKANRAMEYNGGLLRICDHGGFCHDSKVVEPVRAWVQSAKSMPWIPLENYDTDIANIASNFFDNRRRYVYPWNSHPYF